MKKVKLVRTELIIIRIGTSQLGDKLGWFGHVEHKDDADCVN